MEALEFCKRIGDMVGLPLIPNKDIENDKVVLSFDSFVDISWIHIYLIASERWLQIVQDMQFGYEVREISNTGDNEHYSLVRGRTLTPCLKELKKILKDERVIA